MLKTGNNESSSRLAHYRLALFKNLKSLGGWVGKSLIADAIEMTARPVGHMLTFTQASAVCEK